MADQFQEMLQTFYKKANQSKQAYLYQAVLQKELDAAEDEPIHVISVKEAPSNSKPPNKNRKTHKPPESLYKSCDFPTIFLFAFFRKALHMHNLPFFKDLHGQIINNLIELEDRHKILCRDFQITFIDEVFGFFHLLKEKGYGQNQIDNLLKQFFVKNFQKKGFRRADIERYGTTAHKFVDLLLSKSSNVCTLAQLMSPISVLYKENPVNTSILLKDHITSGLHTIGQGTMNLHITIYNCFFVVEKESCVQYDYRAELTEAWQGLLEESRALGEKQRLKEFEIEESEKDSVKSPKSVRIIESIRKNKYNFINFP